MARHLFSMAFPAVLALGACTKSPPPSEDPRPEPPADTAGAAATPAPSAGGPAIPPAHGQSTPDDVCKALEETPLPAADAPTPEERKALAGCDAEALYYGIGRPVDYAAARKCAFVERDLAQPPVIGGVAMLMMVYANGKGVPPNLDLAGRFACEVSSAMAERDARIDRIRAARASGQREMALDVCDDMTSSLLMGWCRRHEERIASAERDAKKRAFTKGLPAAALARLDKAVEAFVEARALKEVDLTGTMRAVFSIGERARLRQEYVDMLRKLVDPAFSPPTADATQVERGLQKAYDRVMACKKEVPTDSLAVNAKGIRETELAWLAYRTAWFALVAEARPGADADAWKAWITERRTKMLKDLAEYC